MGRSALIGGHGSTSSSSSSSSIGHETNNNNNYHFNSRDLTTDLNLGLTISPASQSHQQHHDFINPASFFPRDNELMQSSASDHNYSTINPYNQMVGAGEGSDQQQQYDQKYSNSNSNGNSRLYVKVYMEGHPIGRKLDMLAHSGYHDLITTLDHMFNTNILWGAEVDAEKCEEFHVLTYEDEEGDWLMVGDVPWEMFLSAVKRLKISRACPC